MFCKRCRYNLKGVETTCPECGRAFDAANPKTYRKRVGLPKFVRWLFQGLAVSFVVAAIPLGVIEVRYQQELATAEALVQIDAYVRWSEDAHPWAKRIPFLHQRLQHVYAIGLYDSQLTSLPPELWKLTNLTKLDFGNNQLTTLPPEIGKLSKLEVLNLNNNQIAALPPALEKLTKLEMLFLIANPITDTDLERLNSLENLQHLNLIGTKVTGQGVPSLQLALPHCKIYSDFEQEKP